MRLTNVCRTPDNLVSIRMYLEQFSKGFDECRALQTECSVGIVALSVITVRKYSWISWCILPWELEGITFTMLPADWSISTSHDPLPSSCPSERMLWNPSIVEGSGTKLDV